MAKVHRAVPLRGGIKKTDLIEAMQYSGAELTEDMTDKEILAALAAEFPPYTYLFRANKINLLTAGWNTSAQAGSMTEPAVDADGYLSMTVSGSPYLNRIHKAGFDLTGYKKLCFKVEECPASSGNANSLVALGFYSANNAGNTVLPVKYCSFDDANLFVCDIEELTGVYYLGIPVRYRQAGNIKISEIYLQ